MMNTITMAVNNDETVTVRHEKINRDKIIAKELLLFLQKDMNLTKTQYEKFCLRYADRDISTIVRYLKKFSDNKVTPKVIVYLKQELREEAKRIRSLSFT